MKPPQLVFALLLAVAGVTSGCGDEAPPVVEGDLPDVSLLRSLEITPARSDLALVRGMTTQTQLRLTGRYADGQSRDLTRSVAWTVSGPPATVRDGLFVTSSPGAFTVSVTLNARLAQATVNVRVTGDLSLADAPADAAARLGGAVAGGARPEVAYPLDGAIFPANLGDVEVHVTKTHASQSIARVWFTGTHVDLSMYGRCQAIPNAPMGCAITVDRALVASLVAASEGAEMNLRVRLAAPDGSQLAESAPREVRWTSVNLTGALYYWSTRLGANATAIYRYNLESGQTPPEAFFLQTRDAPVVGGERPCVGCHTVSRDGRRMALSFGGSDPGNFGVYDIATRQPIATRLGDHAYGAPATFAAMSALNPDGSRVITALRGTLTLRRVDASLAAVGGPLFATGLTPGDRATQPYWSPDGRALAFVGWNPSMYDCTSAPCGDNRPKDNGDLAPYGQVYLASIDGDMVGAPRLLAPRSAGNGGREYTSHYPSVSDDGRWVAFNRVRCDARGNDQGYAVDRTASAANCSGYDNPGARVMLVPATGGAVVDLARLNGTDTWTNSWPRWAPNHGRFRGTELYWVAFSSKRPYGLRLPGDNTGRSMTVPPQLWFGAVTLGQGDVMTGDPSHAPIWMPRQNLDAATPSGNHVPQWTAVFVPTPG
ncbi:MAG: hypothetical protein U0324_26560 [Polyangiales bacterium]